MIDNNLKIISLVLVAFVAAGAGFMITPDNGNVSTDINSSTDTENVSFSVVPIGHANVYLWGIEILNQSSPIEIVHSQSGDRVQEKFLNGEVSMVDLRATQAAEVLAKDPDAKILPYHPNIKDDFPVIHTWENSSIDSPEDLDGKTVEVVGFRNIPKPADIILREVYDAEVNWTFRNGSIEDTKDSLRKENVDAVYILGDKRLQKKNITGLKPVYSTTDTLEREFGARGLPRFFIVKNDPEAIETGFKAIESFKKSAQSSQEHKEEFKRTHSYCNEFLIENASKKQIKRISPEFESQMQFLLDSAYEQGVIDQKINVSERVIRRNTAEG